MGGTGREWLAAQMAAECERQEAATVTTDRRSAGMQLRRRVSALQVAFLCLLAALALRSIGAQKHNCSAQAIA